MTLAIVLAAGSPAASLSTETGETIGDRLADQWHRAGASEVRVVADLDELADLAGSADGRWWSAGSTWSRTRPCCGTC